MSILDINQKYKFPLGILLCIIAIIFWIIVWFYDTGFLFGFITGITTAFGIGLLVTYKKQE
ncbi:MAG: hypothetical protein HKO92_07895 [Flavobacteriaceae bacterium]|nr:hypothetical protein [Flavobacteriaceae bacterium]